MHPAGEPDSIIHVLTTSRINALGDRHFVVPEIVLLTLYAYYTARWGKAQTEVWKQGFSSPSLWSKGRPKYIIVAKEVIVL